MKRRNNSLRFQTSYLYKSFTRNINVRCKHTHTQTNIWLVVYYTIWFIFAISIWLDVYRKWKYSLVMLIRWKYSWYILMIQTHKITMLSDFICLQKILACVCTQQHKSKEKEKHDVFEVSFSFYHNDILYGVSVNFTKNVSTRSDSFWIYVIIHFRSIDVSLAISANRSGFFLLCSYLDINNVPDIIFYFECVYSSLGDELINFGIFWFRFAYIWKWSEISLIEWHVMSWIKRRAVSNRKRADKEQKRSRTGAE